MQNDIGEIMDKNIEITIIMPVYNIYKKKKFFLKAIKSIEKQNNVKKEILLVNDGSTDETLKVLKEIKRKNEDIRIINKKNGGVESARRRGIQEAKGKFIFHMDQDDLLSPNALFVMLENANKNDIDIVVGASRRLFGRVKFGKIPECMLETKIVSHDEFMKDLYCSFFGINIMPVNIWGKLYRKSFLDSCPTPPLTGQINEDLSYNMHIFPYAEKIMLLSDVVYYYRWGGFTNHEDKTLIPTMMINYEYKLKCIEKYKRNELKIFTAIELLNYLYTYLYQKYIYTNVQRDELVSIMKELYKEPYIEDAIKCVKENIEKANWEKIQILANRDFEKIWQMIEKQKKDEKIKLVLKNILLKIQEI